MSRMGMASCIRRWRSSSRALEHPIDGASLAIFRILFGELMLWEVVRYVQFGRIGSYFIQPVFHFTYPFFEWVKPWPGNGMCIHFAVMGLAALGVALGLWYRFSAGAFFLTYTYVFLIDKTYYNNHYYLIILLAGLLTVANAHHWASLDSWRHPRLRSGRVPRWHLLIPRVQIALVYFYGGIAKLNPDWLRGEPLRLWLADRADHHVLGAWLAQPWVAVLLSYSGLGFDLAIGFLLMWPKTRLLALIGVVVFNLTNAWLFSIGIFPILMIAATVLFGDPGWPRRIVEQLKRPWRLAGFTRTARAEPPMDPAPSPSVRWRPLVCVSVYLAVQILVPLRHWLYPGQVSWTEEGHRFAWHMKLRDKDGVLAIRATDPRTGASWTIDPSQDLTPKQVDEMSVRPDMIWQYVQFLRRTLEAEGIARPVITAEARVSLNGRPAQLLIDPAANLAAIDYPPFSHAAWILPLRE